MRPASRRLRFAGFTHYAFVDCGMRQSNNDPVWMVSSRAIILMVSIALSFSKYFGVVICPNKTNYLPSLSLDSLC